MSLRKKMLWLWLLMVTLVTTSTTVNFASASPENVLYVDPPVIWDTEYDIGDLLTVEVKVDYVEHLWAYQFDLSFNPDVLHGVSVDNGDFLGSQIPPPLRPFMIFTSGGSFDNIKGKLVAFMAGIHLTPPPPPWYFPSGSGTLAIVTFEVVGHGISGIRLGSLTRLFDPALNELHPSAPHQHGLFLNTENAPELYIRKRGAQVWPEWHVNYWCTGLQTLYCRIINYGYQGANVKVKFTVVASGYPTKVYSTTMTWIDACAYDPETDEIIPGEVVVSASFKALGPGVFYVSARLYLAPEDFPYELAQPLFGGEGISRDIATKFKAVTQM